MPDRSILHEPLWIMAGLLALAAIAVLVLVGSAHGLMPQPVHAPFPNARLSQQSMQVTLAGGAVIHRRYTIQAPFHEVVEWYQGMDSLLPVSRGANAGCFSQTFSARPAQVLPWAFGALVESVTVCATARGVSVESLTQFRLPPLSALWP